MQVRITGKYLDEVFKTSQISQIPACKIVNNIISLYYKQLNERVITTHFSSSRHHKLLKLRSDLELSFSAVINKAIDEFYLDHYPKVELVD